jgi:putative protease
MRAQNFTVADLPNLMEFLHCRGVKGYVTFNTLIFTNELPDAQECLRSIIVAGVDAAIVQDVGICRLIRQLSPDFPIHASTQMTITSIGGVDFAREIGCNLVVLARECSLKEIETIQAAQSAVNNTPDALSATGHSSLPLEVFVHGALCVAYSGQCLTSEALGGRSANRGECAQACRMPYELISDGKQVPLGDKRYLLSPQDLAGLDVLPELVHAGIASLKIEGRLKTPEYVANVTQVYRRALDRVFSELTVMHGDASSGLLARRSLPETRQGAATQLIAPLSADQVLRHNDGVASLITAIGNESRYNLEMAFSRGLYTGWFRGINNQRLAHARFGKKRGVYLGEVRAREGENVVVRLEGPLKAGDGVVFDAGHPDQDEEGGRVYHLQCRGREAVLTFGQNCIDFARVHIGDKLWKTSDPKLDQQLRQTFSGDQPHFRRPIHLELHGRLGQSLNVIARDDLGYVVKVDSSMVLSRAEKQPLVTERLREQLGRLGRTPFRLASLKNLLTGDVMLPISELNRLRREFVKQLVALRAQPKRWVLRRAIHSFRSHSECFAKDALDEPQEIAGSSNLRPAKTLPDPIVLVRNLHQLEAALKCGVQTLYCEFEDPKRYHEAVDRYRQWSREFSPSAGRSEPGIFVTPPRIFKTGEEWILKQVRSCDADGYLVRNYDHLKSFTGCRRIGDFSLNIANPLTADYFINHAGLERVSASYDLNISQLEALLQSAPPTWFEITIHQHMPMFHMEHCVFCAFLSKGTDYTNCGRPCDKHEVKLRDRVGAEHPLKADVGCRNTVFNARAQTGAEYVSRLIALGAYHFRIEFLNESTEQVIQTIGQYRQLLRGEITGTQLWQELKLMNQLGVTRGQMEKEDR